MTFTIIDSLLAVAEQSDAPENERTTFWLAGRILYPDELFSPQGFMPLLARMAERQIKRMLDAPDMHCGFEYTPDRNALFSEACFALPAGGNVLEDGVRLPALVDVSRQVLGLGYQGSVDITPVYEFFTGMTGQARDAIKQADDKEIKAWPLYKVLKGV